jgi:hypothetical protein
MKVKEKAAFCANYGCMLTLGMRECKLDISRGESHPQITQISKTSV